MRRERVEIFDPRDIPDALIDRVMDLLEAGGIIGYPTETVYGLGGHAADERSIEKVYRLKGRGFRKPLLILVADQEDVFPLVRRVSGKARILMERFWPGPLTLVFPASSVLPRSLRGGKDKVGIRVSSDSFCRRLLGTYRKPLLSTSANPAGKPPARSAVKVLDYFGEGVDLILDGGERRLGVPSTVLDVEEDPPRLLRRGIVGKDEIERVIGEIDEAESR